MKRPSLMTVNDIELKRVFTAVFNEMKELSRRLDQAINAQLAPVATVAPFGAGGSRAPVTSTVTLNSTHGVVLCDASGGAFTVTLPGAFNSGWRYYVKKIDTSGNVVTVDGDGSETIDDDLTLILASQYDAAEIVSDGTEWWIV